MKETADPACEFMSCEHVWSVNGRLCACEMCDRGVVRRECMCSRVFRGVFRCLGTLSECARGRQCEQVRTCACVRVEWVCVRTRAMLLFFFFFTTHHPPSPVLGCTLGYRFLLTQQTGEAPFYR